MERIYQEIIHRFREEQAENENKVNALNKRSMELDNHISALREENLVSNVNMKSLIAKCSKSSICFWF